MTARVACEPAPLVGVPQVPWPVVLPLASLLVLADEFWVVALRTSVGAVEWSSDPATSWLRESVVLLPVYVVAVVAGLALARRWWGGHPGGGRSAVGTVVVVALVAALAGGVILAVSAAYDFRLQVQALVDHTGVHGGCDDPCLQRRVDGARSLELRSWAVGVVLMLLTNLVVVAWVTALRGRPLQLAVHLDRAATRTRDDDERSVLRLVLVGAAVVHGVVIPEHLAKWAAAGGFFVVVAGAQLAGALVLRRRPDRVWLVVVAAGSAALLALWAWSRTLGLPFGPQPWEPEPVGLADAAAGVLELAAVALCLARLGRGRAPLRERRSAQARGIAVASVAAVTALGIGGSALPGVGLVPEAPTHLDGGGAADVTTR